MSELFDVYDKNRQLTGKIMKRGDRLTDEEYRVVVQVWIKNSSGQWLLSKRSENKSYPLKWEPTGGCVLSGETSLECAIREVREELGIELIPGKGVLFATFRREKCCWENPGFLDIWVFEKDVSINDIMLQPSETCEAKWASYDEIAKMISCGEFIPVEEYPYYKELLDLE